MFGYRSLARVIGALIPLLLLLPAQGCGTDHVQGGAVCTYGTTIPCETDGGCDGVRTCLPDLTGYSACACPADAAADAPADASDGSSSPPDAATDGGATAP